MTTERRVCHQPSYLPLWVAASLLAACGPHATAKAPPPPAPDVVPASAEPDKEVVVRAATLTHLRLCTKLDVTKPDVDAGESVRYETAIELPCNPYKITTLARAAQMPALVYLELHGVWDEPLDVLGKSKTLKELVLVRTKGVDISALANVARLRSLRLVDAEVRDMVPIYRTRLEKLVAPGAALDATMLPAMTTLTDLQIDGTGVDLRRLLVMTQLRRLIFGGKADLRGIGALQELRELALSGPVSNFGDIAKLSQLRVLTIEGKTGAVDLRPLEKLAKLEHLVIAEGRVSKAAVERLRAVNPKLTVTLLTCFDCKGLETKVWEPGEAWSAGGGGASYESPFDWAQDYWNAQAR